MLDKEIYLGDGLYASYDGFQVMLRAPTTEEDRVVYLEPGVVRALQRYLEDLEQSQKSLPK